MINSLISKKVYIKYPIQTFVFKTKFNNHNLLKNKLLNFFDDVDERYEFFNEQYSDFIDKLDWSQEKNFERPWCKFLEDHILQNLDFIIESVGYQNYKITSLWFQQYKIGSSHGWHVHGGNFTGIYYLELPKDAPTTQLIVPFTQNEIINLDVSEGDIILFPSHVIHRAPPMINQTRKTIISFNIDAEEVSLQTLDILKKLNQNNI